MEDLLDHPSTRVGEVGEPVDSGCIRPQVGSKLWICAAICQKIRDLTIGPPWDANSSMSRAFFDWRPGVDGKMEFGADELGVVPIRLSVRKSSIRMARHYVTIHRHVDTAFESPSPNPRGHPIGTSDVASDTSDGHTPSAAGCRHPAAGSPAGRPHTCSVPAPRSLPLNRSVCSGHGASRHPVSRSHQSSNRLKSRIAYDHGSLATTP